MKIKNAIAISVALFLFSCQKDRDWLDYSPIDMYSATIEYDDSQASKFLNVAAVSIQVSKNDKVETLNSMKTMVEKIKTEHSEVQVIVFGELILEWYYDDELKSDYQRNMSEVIPGPSSSFIKNLAIQNNVNIVFGLTELDSITQKLYNTQLLVKPTGQIVKYRKRNLNQTDIDNDFYSGNELVTDEIEGVKVALFICSDMQSDEVTDDLTSAKVDVVLHSLTSTTDMNPSISYVGMQLNTWIVFANRYGNEGIFDYTGFTHIISPVGSIIERTIGKNTYVYRKLGILEK